MTLIEKYTDITKNLVELFNQPNLDEIEDMDFDISDSVTSLLQQRQELLSQIKPPFSAEERSVYESLVPLEKELNEKLVTFRMELAEELRKIQFLKRGNDKYANPYENVQADGMFYDKKK